jgi:superfamily II DNA or RNA helicase
MAENNFTNGIVYYSGYLSSQVIKRSKSIKYINLPYKTCETINLIPHSYQIDAYNKLSISGRNVLTMPCGTGKTYVSYLLSANYKNIIILSPLISTAEQLYLFYKKYYNNTETHNISIFNCLNKSRLIDLEKNNVIISTYDSVNLILEKVSKLDNKIIIIDEYHNLSPNNFTNTDDYINKLLKFDNTSYLFMSATPHKLRHQFIHILGNNEYTLGWEDAIKNKYICDYKFYYPNPDNVNVKIIELKKTTILSSLEVQKCILLNKAYYLLECIKECRVKKIIVFLKSLA